MDVLLRGCRAVSTGDLQAGQLAVCCLFGYRILLGRFRALQGKAQSYVLCVPVLSQRCKAILHPYGSTVPFFFTEENWIPTILWGQKQETCLVLVVFTEY